jgi:glyoxylase-like metal-dependent hydrolase (beta-lactamase superfamily II)
VIAGSRPDPGGALPAGIRLIDVRHLGRPRVIGSWQVGDVVIDPGPTSCLPNLLEALGDVRPRAVLLTHVHLDHAGATGALVERWPELEVYVHQRGARHLVDPSRLVDSATRLYGERMGALWGEMLPVPEDRLRVVIGGESLLDGEFEVAYTPGHAWHHVSYLHRGTAFAGDAAGVRIAPERLTFAPTPPPDIDLEAWHESIARLAAWQPDRIAVAHFGAVEDVDRHLADLGERLDEYAERVRTQDLEAFLAGWREDVERFAGAEMIPTYEQAAAPEQLYAGLDRYWRKRDESLASEPGTAVS